MHIVCRFLFAVLFIYKTYAMTLEQISKMTAEKIIKAYGCTSIDDLNGILTYEIKRQYATK